MKTVGSNSEAAQAFVSRRGEKFDGTSLYYVPNNGNPSMVSYHTTIAKFSGSGHIIIDGDYNSLTTERHKALVRSAAMYRWDKTRIEQINAIVTIPFSSMKTLGIDILTDSSNVYVVDAREDEYLDETVMVDEKDENGNRTGKKVEKVIKVHKLGATLIKFYNATTKKERFFLSSRDNGIKRRRDGFFMVELPEKCSNVEKAFELLKPKELIGKKEGVDYMRQGEFFFVPETDDTDELMHRAFHDSRARVATNTREVDYAAPNLTAEQQSIELRNSYGSRILRFKKRLRDGLYVVAVIRTCAKDDNRYTHKYKDIAKIFRGKDAKGGNPHVARDMIYGGKDSVYVRGCISHPEHKAVNLKETWHRVLINRAINSVSFYGRID